jgi:hypothetical protein
MGVRIRERKVERAADLRSFRQIGYSGVGRGLAPDDSPLLLGDTGAQEIYALGWQTPKLTPAASRGPLPYRILASSVREDMAERVGFEPTVGFLLHTLSKRAP